MRRRTERERGGFYEVGWKERRRESMGRTPFKIMDRLSELVCAVRTTARFECVAGLQPKLAKLLLYSRNPIRQCRFALSFTTLPILFGSPFPPFQLRQIVRIEILSVYVGIWILVVESITNLSTEFLSPRSFLRSHVRFETLDKFRNHFRKLERYILDKYFRNWERFNMKVYIRSWASSFIDGPPILFVSKFLL